jgi:hypothetical protein
MNDWPRSQDSARGAANDARPAGKPEPKIVVDEDWKSRVERERLEQLEQERRQGTQRSSSANQDLAAEGPGSVETGPPEGAFPPASFETLLTTLATEALIGLGEIPHPATGKMETNLPHARYVIDMLEMLQRKTQGNLTPGESQALDAILHQLRLGYVSWEARSP